MFSRLCSTLTAHPSHSSGPACSWARAVVCSSVWRWLTLRVSAGVEWMEWGLSGFLVHGFSHCEKKIKKLKEQKGITVRLFCLTGSRWWSHTSRPTNCYMIRDFFLFWKEQAFKTLSGLSRKLFQYPGPFVTHVGFLDNFAHGKLKLIFILIEISFFSLDMVLLLNLIRFPASLTCTSALVSYWPAAQ